MPVFEGLSEKLRGIVNKLKGSARITEKDVKDIMREIRLALLEADVNYKVVKDFVQKVSERAVGREVMESLTPGQQVIKIVHEELIDLMGKTPAKITFSPKPPTVYMLCGLQGSGKTTTCGKLANILRKQHGKKPVLVACDIYRPAAIKQLQVVGSQLDIPVYAMGEKKSPVEIAKTAISYAIKNMHDLVILDTAGRLHIDEELMKELKDMKSAVKPHAIILVVDSMTGQDAVNVAEAFNSSLGIDGVILTKLDSDTRGGAALSVAAVTGKPVLYAGIGEKLNDIEPFYPDRMASRILGMGDVLSLIEKAQEAFDEKKAMELEKKLRSQQFTLEDFLDQMEQLKKMGPLSQVLGMLPGVDAKALANTDADEKGMVRMEAIIKSMTKKERNNPAILNASRKKRIAAGSGTTIQEINRLLKSFEQMKAMMKNIGNLEKMSKRGGLRGFRLPF
jgi:signal recognition particle subunit SRP54